MGGFRQEPALLVLADGAEFEGEAIGAFADPEAELSVAAGEFVFNTALSGYQEVLTDPSYAGQVVTFTYPHIGNYGTNPADEESGGGHRAGIVVRGLAPPPSNWRPQQGRDAYLPPPRGPCPARIAPPPP